MWRQGPLTGSHSSLLSSDSGWEAVGGHFPLFCYFYTRLPDLQLPHWPQEGLKGEERWEAQIEEGEEGWKAQIEEEEEEEEGWEAQIKEGGCLEASRGGERCQEENEQALPVWKILGLC